jgi:hypothetical protein
LIHVKSAIEPQSANNKTMQESFSHQYVVDPSKKRSSTRIKLETEQSSTHITANKPSLNNGPITIDMVTPELAA